MKKWYEKVWVITLFSIFFPLVGIVLILINKHMQKKTKIILSAVVGIWLLFTGISAFNDASKIKMTEVAKEENTLIVKDKKIEVINKKEAAKQEKTQEQKNAEIKNKVEQEKKNIHSKILQYENEHLPTWNKMTESMQKNDVYGAYENADKALVQVTNIWQDSSKLNWGNTGDVEFDKHCKELKEEINMAYFLKRESLKKLMAWFDDTQSPKKMNDAKKSLEETAEYWQMFQLKAAAVTMTEEDLKKAAEEAKKTKK